MGVIRFISTFHDNAGMSRVITPRVRAHQTRWGCSTKVPLPPLKSVLVVLVSSPLLKSIYSLKEFTLTWEETAPIRARRAYHRFTFPVSHKAVETPKSAHTGGSARKGTLAGPSFFGFLRIPAPNVCGSSDRLGVDLNPNNGDGICPCGVDGTNGGRLISIHGYSAQRSSFCLHSRGPKRTGQEASCALGAHCRHAPHHPSGDPVALHRD